MSGMLEGCVLAARVLLSTHRTQSPLSLRRPGQGERQPPCTLQKPAQQQRGRFGSLFVSFSDSGKAQQPALPRLQARQTASEAGCSSTHHTRADCASLASPAAAQAFSAALASALSVSNPAADPSCGQAKPRESTS